MEQLFVVLPALEGEDPTGTHAVIPFTLEKARRLVAISELVEGLYNAPPIGASYADLIIWEDSGVLIRDRRTDLDSQIGVSGYAILDHFDLSEVEIIGTGSQRLYVMMEDLFFSFVRDDDCERVETSGLGFHILREIVERLS